VKSRLQIADVVGETVQLKKAGTTFKGLCPFHGEKTPSFVVTPARESWKCFGCGLGGDVFSFVMQRDSVSFPEALKTLAARAGVELDERTARDDARKGRLRDVLETAIAWYHVVLTSSRTGRPALDYLHDRGFTDETISRFQLGWAPGGWDTMSSTLAKKRQIRPEELAEVGLTSPRQGAGAAPTTASASGSSSRSATRAGERSAWVAGTSSRRASPPTARTRATTDRNTSTPRRRSCSTRAGRCTSSTRPRAPSARAARR
jgi:DNA primase catalytic core